MRSFRLRMVLWFGLSLFAITGVFVAVTFAHLDYELRQETWERAGPQHPGWTLHGSYSHEEVADITGELVRLSLLYAFPLLLVSLLMGYHLARRAMRPVEVINTQLRAIGARNIEQRVQLRDADQEFVAVQDQINALLDRLQEAFVQLSEFSAQVAHDLRTPLTLLRLRVEEAAASLEPEVAEPLQDELSQLTGYVDRCLLLARAEQRRITLNVERIDMRALLGDLIDVYELLAADQGRSIEVVHGEADCVVEADRTQLHHILHNLLTNALKHGAGAIVVGVARADRRVSCRIENTVAAGPAASRQGLGLGLRVVKSLVALHAGMLFEAGARDGVFVAEISMPAA